MPSLPAFAGLTDSLFYILFFVSHYCSKFIVCLSIGGSKVGEDKHFSEFRFGSGRWWSRRQCDLVVS